MNLPLSHFPLFSSIFFPMYFLLVHQMLVCLWPNFVVKKNSFQINFLSYIIAYVLFHIAKNQIQLFHARYTIINHVFHFCKQYVLHFSCIILHRIRSLVVLLGLGLFENLLGLMTF